MAILQSHGVLLVDSIPTHTPVGQQAKLARLQDTLTMYYYDGSIWQTVNISALGGFQTAAQTTVADVAGNYTATDTEGVLAEIATSLSGIAHTSITSIDLKSNGNANEYIVEIVWVDDNGTTQTTTDSTPITVSGATDLGYTPSATQGIVTSTTGVDAVLPIVDNTNAGLQSPLDKVKSDFITVTQPVDLDQMESDITDLQTEPVGYLSKAAALAALGAGVRFQYLAANLDGAVEGVSAWT